MAADTCSCGAEPMQPDWSAVTDRAWKQHTREACFDRPRPMGVADSEWAEIERLRAQRTPRTPAPTEG